MSEEGRKRNLEGIQARKGIPRSPEHCANISKAKKGKPTKLKGYKAPLEVRLKLSKAKKGCKKTEEQKKAQSERQRGKKRKPHKEETREKIRAAIIQVWANRKAARSSENDNE